MSSLLSTHLPKALIRKNLSKLDFTLSSRYCPGPSFFTAIALFSSVPATSSEHQTPHYSASGEYGVYHKEYQASIHDKENFWGKAAQYLHWFQKPNTVLKKVDDHYYRWFPDGLTNTCYNCLDLHVEQGRGNQPAIIYDSPVTGVKESYTYNALLQQVATFAGALTNLGVRLGDRVIIYMPMIPQALVAMLACARIGAIHSVVFGGFAANQLATRIQDCNPKLVITASAAVEPSHVVHYKPLVDEALAIGKNNVQHCIVYRRKNIDIPCEMSAIDLDYEELMAKSSKVDAVPLPANHPHYILYTSGTTGHPKGVLRDTAGYAVALKYTMTAFYNTDPGQVFWAASDIGWVVGHSYTVYGPLLNGCTTVVYEGKPVGTPDAGAFWRVIAEHKVNTFFTAPTAIRAIKQFDPQSKLADKYDLSSLKNFFLAGEHSDPDTLQYCKSSLQKYGSVCDPIDHWWQTELGHPGIGNALGLGRMPLKPGACAGPAPGYEIAIIDNHGKPLPKGVLGNMVIKTPLPPGTLVSLYNNDKEYIKSYLKRYPGYYDTGDAAFISEDGYISVMGRTDDVIITAGHRLSTGSMEEILQSHSQVADCAVIPVRDDLKGHVPVGFVVTIKDCAINQEQLKQELILLVREKLGPVASFKKVAVVRALPKTRSGKILRGTMTKIADGQEYKITPTVEDPKIFEYLEPIIRDLVDSEQRSKK